MHHLALFNAEQPLAGSHPDLTQAGHPQHAGPRQASGERHGLHRPVGVAPPQPAVLVDRPQGVVIPEDSGGHVPGLADGADGDLFDAIPPDAPEPAGAQNRHLSAAGSGEQAIHRQGSEQRTARTVGAEQSFPIADPEVAAPIHGQGANPADRQPPLRQRMAEAIPVPARHAAPVGAHPDTAVGSRRQGPDEVIGQAVFFGDGQESPPVVTGHPSAGPHPQVAQLVLGDGPHLRLGQPLLDGHVAHGQLLARNPAGQT